MRCDYRTNADRRYPRVIGNAAGWAIGLPCIFIAAQLAADQSGWIPRIALWAFGDVGAGASVGVLTGIALRRMTAPRSAVNGEVQD